MFSVLRVLRPWWNNQMTVHPQRLPSTTGLVLPWEGDVAIQQEHSYNTIPLDVFGLSVVRPWWSDQMSVHPQSRASTAVLVLAHGGHVAILQGALLHQHFPMVLSVVRVIRQWWSDRMTVHPQGPLCDSSSGPSSGGDVTTRRDALLQQFSFGCSRSERSKAMVE